MAIRDDEAEGLRQEDQRGVEKWIRDTPVLWTTGSKAEYPFSPRLPTARQDQQCALGGGDAAESNA